MIKPICLADPRGARQHNLVGFEPLRQSGDAIAASMAHLHVWCFQRSKCGYRHPKRFAASGKETVRRVAITWKNPPLVVRVNLPSFHRNLADVRPCLCTSLV